MICTNHTFFTQLSFLVLIIGGLLYICVFLSMKHQDDVKGEEDMAAKKAALLEKRLQREKEAQERKQQQELDQEQKREAARSVCLSDFLPVFRVQLQFAFTYLSLGFLL